MEDWKEYKIGDVCASISDTYKGKASEVVLINTSDVLEGKCLNHEKTPNKDLKGQFKKTFQKDDILYSEIRPANKRFAYVDFEPNDYIASTKLMVIRSNEKIDSQYLFYILKSQSMLDELQMLAESRSGTFPQITFSELANLSVTLPCITKQKKILAILKSLDDKIECNRKINENLEQQAQALFKSWFVDFGPFKDQPFVESELGMIPQGWKVGHLSEVADITMGASPAGTSYNVIGDGDVFYQGRAEFSFRFPRRNMYTTEAKRFADVNSVLLSVRAPVGDINIAEERCCIGRGLASVKSNEGYNSYIFYLMRNLKPIFDQFNGEGTVFGSINKKSLEELSILIAPKELRSKFEEITNKIDSEIKVLDQESRRLAELRDALLPKLMSGEINVSDVKI